MAKKAQKKLVRREYTKDDEKTLRAHSKAQTPLEQIAKEMKRTGGSLRQKAIKLGIPLGHRRRKAVKGAVSKTTKTAKTAKTAKKAVKAKTAKAKKAKR
jgi:ribosomal protein L13E